MTLKTLSRYFIPLLVANIVTCSTYAHSGRMGPGDSGGGNGLMSKKESLGAAFASLPTQVKGISIRLKTYLQEISDANFEKHFANIEVKYNLLEVLKGNSNRNLGLTHAIDQDQIHFMQEDSECFGKSDRDAQANQNEVCFVTSRILKFNPTALNAEFIALAFHEVSHLYGMNEEQAQAIQNFALKTPQLFNPHPIDESEVFELLRTANFETLSLKTNPLEICFGLGRISKRFYETGILSNEFKRTAVEMPMSFKKEFLKIAGEVDAASNLCSKKETLTSSEDLKSKLTTIHKMVSPFSKKLYRYLLARSDEFFHADDRTMKY